MQFEDLSGISDGNLEGILVYLFRPTTLGEA